MSKKVLIGSFILLSRDHHNMTFVEDLNASSTLITAIATAVLATLTFMYLRETSEIREESERYRKTFVDESEKSRIEAKKPILSLQSDDDPASRWHGLYLCNYGPIARHVTVTYSTSTQTRQASSLFMYTLGPGERLNISGDWTSVREAGGRISVDVLFHDTDMREYHPSPMIIDYDQITTSTTIVVPVLQPARVDCYQMNPTR
jgi:hypothetical protein